MSSSIWTACGGRSSCRPLRLRSWRVVEAQHRIATRRLVDTDAEQELLEALVEATKPPLPDHEGLHWLLATPFRYPPLRYGSRFGRPHERGLWYGAEELRTAFAEVAWYLLRFLDDTEAPLAPRPGERTAYRVRLAADVAVDLVSPPYDAHRDVIASKSSHAATQALGTALRDDGVAFARFPSARAEGANVVVFDPAAFVERTPRTIETWTVTATREAVEVQKRTLVGRRVRHRFERDAFLVDGALPSP